MFISRINAKFLKLWMANNYPEWEYFKHRFSNLTRSEYFVFRLCVGHPLRHLEMGIRISDHKRTRRYQHYITTFRLGNHFEGDFENCLRSTLGRARKEIKDETRKLNDLKKLVDYKPANSGSRELASV